MRFPGALALAVPLALSLTVTACSGSGTPATAAASSATTVVVGATLPLTGSLDASGLPLEAGYEQEIANVNAAGGVTLGGARAKLRLVVLDDAGNPATAAAQTAELVRRDHAAALLGPSGPELVLPVAQTAEQLKIPLLTSLMPTGAFAAGDKDGWTYSWDLFYGERQQAAAAAKALAAVPGAKKVALFTDSSPDAVTEGPLYQAAFTAAGLDVVGDYTVPEGTASFSPDLAAARKAGAQLLAAQLTPADGDTLGKELTSSGLSLKAAFLTGPAETGAWWQPLGSVAPATLAGAVWSPAQASSGQLTRISATLGKKYGSGAGYGPAALGYAVAEVLTDALTTAGSSSPARLKAAIGRTDKPTVAGPITFSSATHTAVTPYSVTQQRG